MKFYEHKQVIKRNLLAILIISILVGAAAFLFSYYSPTKYKTSISFAVNRINKQETADYQFDGYYAIQASDLFSQTVVSWFYTPSVLMEIYDLAEVEPNITTLERFTNRFKTKKYSSQNIVVIFQERDHTTAEKISQSIISTVQERGAELNRTSDQKALFEIVGSTPVIVEQKPMLILNTVVGLVVGLFLSLGLIYFIRYLRTE
ncbi:hypothetical protein KKG41_02110 [Patescibacteria group bacterium]|nr:hypothetical protein [Patescibacteria group bacterium]MBU1889901.1 hypothetical protein [Patescibacteria group bacterium]